MFLLRDKLSRRRPPLSSWHRLLRTANPLYLPGDNNQHTFVHDRDRGRRRRRRVVFMGTPEPAVTALDVLLGASASSAGTADEFEVIAAVTRPPARGKKGKKKLPSPVHARAVAADIEVLIPPTAKDNEFLGRLEELDADLFVTAAYGCYLPRALLRLPPPLPGPSPPILAQLDRPTAYAACA